MNFAIEIIRDTHPMDYSFNLILSDDSGLEEDNSLLNSRVIATSFATLSGKYFQLQFSNKLMTTEMLIDRHDVDFPE
ncbi:MAG: hypothetical protein V3V41_05430 [Candidatus Heimdallarchaeota archaeon]